MRVGLSEQKKKKNERPSIGNFAREEEVLWNLCRVVKIRYLRTSTIFDTRLLHEFSGTKNRQLKREDPQKNCTLRCDAVSTDFIRICLFVFFQANRTSSASRNEAGSTVRV